MNASAERVSAERDSAHASVTNATINAQRSRVVCTGPPNVGFCCSGSNNCGGGATARRPYHGAVAPPPLPKPAVSTKQRYASRARPRTISECSGRRTCARMLASHTWHRHGPRRRICPDTDARPMGHNSRGLPGTRGPADGAQPAGAGPRVIKDPRAPSAPCRAARA